MPVGESGYPELDFNNFLREEKWIDEGIFERNNITGELRLKKKEGQLAGLSTGYLGHFESNPLGISSYKPTENFLENPEDMVLDNKELDEMNREPELDTAFDWLGYATEQAGAGLVSHLVSPAVGAASAYEDVQASIFGKLGMDDASAYFQKTADDLRADANEIKMGANQLTPVMESGHPMKEVGSEWWDAVKNPMDQNKTKEFWKDMIAFQGSVGAPMAAHAGLTLATAGAWSAVVPWAYGLQQFDDTYSTVRYDEFGQKKHDALTGYAAAVPAAIIAGYLENYGYRGLFEESGGRWLFNGLKAVTKEGSTEASQTGEADFIAAIPDAYTDYIVGPKKISVSDMLAWGGKESVKMGLDGAACATSASGIWAMQTSTEAVRSALFGKRPEVEKPSIDASTLSPEVQDQMRKEVGQVKAYLDGSGARTKWTPEHQETFDAISKKWGQVSQTATALKNLYNIYNDPVKVGEHEKLKESTPGGQDVQDFNLDTPAESMWLTVLSHPETSARAGALGTYIESKKVLTTNDSSDIKTQVNTFEVEKLAPTEYRLLLSSLDRAAAGVDTDAGKQNILEAKDLVKNRYEHALNSKNAPKLVESTFGRILAFLDNKDLFANPNTVSTDIGALTQAALKASYYVEKAHGLALAPAQQEVVMKIQDAISKKLAEVPDEGKISSPIWKQGVETIQHLNRFLEADSVAFANKSYVDPIQVFSEMSDEATPLLDDVFAAHSIASSTLDSIAGANAATSSIGVSQQRLMAASREALKQSNLTVHNQALSEQIQQLMDEVDSAQEDGKVSEEAMKPIAEKAAYLQRQVEESKQNSAEKEIAKVLSRWKHAAMEYGAKGVEEVTPPLEHLWNSDDGVIEVKKKAATAALNASADASSQIGNAARIANAYRKAREDGNSTTSYSALYSYIHNLTNDLFARKGGDSILGNHVDKDEVGQAAITLSDAARILYIREEGAHLASGGKAGSATPVLKAAIELNKLGVRMGWLRAAKPKYYAKDKRTGKREFNFDRLRDFGLATGVLEYVQGENGRRLVAKPSQQVAASQDVSDMVPGRESQRQGPATAQEPAYRSFLDVKDQLEASFDSRTKEYRSGKAEWNQAEAEALFKLIPIGTAQSIINYAKNRESDDADEQIGVPRSSNSLAGRGHTFKLAAAIVSSLPNGEAFNANAVMDLVGTSVSDPIRGVGRNAQGVHNSGLDIAGPVLETERVRHVFSKLFALAKTTQKGSKIEPRLNSVIKNIVGLGDYKRHRYSSKAKAFIDLMKQLSQEEGDKLGNPTTELRERPYELNKEERRAGFATGEVGGRSGNIQNLNPTDVVGNIRDWGVDETDTETWDESDGWYEITGNGEKGRWHKFGDDPSSAELDGYEEGVNPLGREWSKQSGDRGDAPTPRHDMEKDQLTRALLQRQYPRIFAEWQKEQDIRAKALVDFYDIMGKAGYKLSLDKEAYSAIDRVRTTGVYDADAKKALAYIDKQLRAVRRAVSQSPNPASMAFQMLAQGYTAEETKLATSFIAALANTWVKETGRSKMDFYFRAVRSFTGTRPNAGSLIGKRNVDERMTYGVMYKVPGFQRLRGAFIALLDKLITPDGRRDFFTPAHEFIHALIDSGQLGLMMPEAERVRASEYLGFQIPTLDLDSGKIKGGNITGEQHEKLIAAIVMSNLSIEQQEDPHGQLSYTQRAMLETRNVLYNYFAHLLDAPTESRGFSGADYLEYPSSIPDDVRVAFVGLFGGDRLSPAVYNVSKDKITMTAAHRLAGQVKSLIGLDISPLLRERMDGVSSIDKPENVQKILKSAVHKQSSRDGFKQAIKSYAQFKIFLGAEGRVSREGVDGVTKAIDDHLFAIWKEIVKNEAIIEEWGKPLFTGKAYTSEYLTRNEERMALKAERLKREAAKGNVVIDKDTSESEEDVNFIGEDDMQYGQSDDIPEDTVLHTNGDLSTGDGLYEDPIIPRQNQYGSPTKEDMAAINDVEDARANNAGTRNTVGREGIQPDARAKYRNPDPNAPRRMAPTPKAQATALDILKPLAFSDISEIYDPLAKLLHTDLPPMMTGNPNSTGKNSQNIAVRWLTAIGNTNIGQLFSSNTFNLEEMLIKRGMTREWFIVQNLGGLYAQAQAAVEHAVVVLAGPMGRQKWTVIGEPLKAIIEEMPDKIKGDVWSYLAARREIELDSNNKRKQKEYDDAVLSTAVLGGNTPKKPKIVDVEPTTLSAAVVMRTVLEAKYGANGGIVGNYAKRIADFGNNAIAKKLYHYGMLSKFELDNLLRDGQWWTPMAYLKEITNDLEVTDPFFNDGTKAALSVLNTDITGSEHPFEELSRRAVSTHILATKAFVRSSLLKNIVDGNHSAQEMAAAGITEIKHMVPKVVSEEVWKASDKKLPVEHDKKTGAKTFLIEEEVALDRRGYQNWVKENVKDKEKVYAIWENGNARYFIIEDSQLRKAIDSMRLKELPSFFKVSAQLVSILARMVTLAPKFIAGMVIKDMPGASSRSRTGINMLTAPADVTRGIFESLPQMFPSLGRRFPKTFWNHNERILSMANQSSFQATFSPHGVDLDSKTSNRGSVLGIMADDFLSAFREKNSIKQLRDAETSNSAIQKIWKPARLVWKGFVTNLERAAATADAALRMTERRLARQGSLGDISRMKQTYARMKDDMSWEAARQEVDTPGYMDDLYVDHLDRQLTLDFSRKGEAVRIIAAMKMFAGPMFQDSASTIEKLTNPVTSSTFILKSFAAFTIPALLNYRRWTDDDDYQRLSYWDKLNFVQINKNKDGTFNQIPTGIGISSVLFKDSFITIAQILTEKDPVAGKEFLNQLIEQTPLQFQPIGQSAGDWMSHLAPSVLEPAAEVAMNYNPLANSPIDYDAGKANAPMAEERGMEKYGVIEKMLAGLLDTSPRMTGYYMKQALPGMGGVLYGIGNQALTEGYKAAGGDPAVGSEYNPVSSYLYKYWSGQVYGPTSLPVNRFYDLYKSASSAKASMEQAYSAGATDKGDSILRSHPEIEYQGMFKDVYGQIVRMKIERGMALKSIDPNDPIAMAQMKENFDKPMTLLAEEVIRTYYNLQRNTYNK